MIWKNPKINESISDVLPCVLLGDDDVVGVAVLEGEGTVDFLECYARIVHPVLEGVTDDLLLLEGCK